MPAVISSESPDWRGAFSGVVRCRHRYKPCFSDIVRDVTRHHASTLTTTNPSRIAVEDTAPSGHPPAGSPAAPESRPRRDHPALQCGSNARSPMTGWRAGDGREVAAVQNRRESIQVAMSRKASAP